MADKLKVTFTTINVTNNGEWRGKGEVYWELTVDDQPVDYRSLTNPLKLADGETVQLIKSATVRKAAGQPLTIQGSVSEKDNLDKDDFAEFLDTYTGSAGWGLGTHKRVLRDGNLDVTVTYKIERQ
ncbi:hypothetical protein [Adhaeribacter pallidiroseus]|uniref:Uncharacterized protein n=1 Tax=Adhaeribacter pallidiroseus TaxID=2072847 RepID=A0A369QMI9_9BACT|nr:hypothetical protein [Adhaeribacter pallidiroseus]RDC65560.1 hypothetical protein AHMF7616_04190 [Adhaeribacter pallidiroseus]